MDVAVAALVLGIVFIAELPDTSALATLVLGSRYPPRLVLVGVAVAHAVHVAVAVAAGSVLALLPTRILEAILAVVFLVGAVLLVLDDDDDDDTELSEEPTTRLRVVTTSFLVVLLAEFGDPTQIVTVTLAARYQDPVAVGVGAVLALWLVSALAVYGGNRLRSVIPLKWVTRFAVAVLVVLAVLSAVDAIRG